MTQLSKIKKALSMFLVFTMILCFTAGCKSTEDEYYSYYEIVEEVEDETESTGSNVEDATNNDQTPDDNASSVDGSTTSTDANTSSANGNSTSANTSSADKNTQSNNGNTTSANTPSADKTPSTNANTSSANGNTPSANTPSADKTPSTSASSTVSTTQPSQPSVENNLATSLKGTTVKVLWWQPFMESEKKVIKDFEAKTGIKVEAKNSTNAGTYGELISASLAAKEGYDIVMFNNIDFPGRPVNYMQPLNDIKGFDLSDSAWDKAVMDTQKIGGKYYGVNINGSNHTEYICMYFNETMFKDRGVKTPREYYEEGKWNWDTFLECAKAMTYKDNGVQIYGYANRGAGYITYWTQAAGTDFIKYDGKQFTSNLGNSKLLDIVKYYNEFGSKLKITDPNTTWGIPDFRSGKVAMHSVISYAMRKDSSTKFNQMTDKIDAVPFPMPKGEKQIAIVDSTLFGVLKGAKNPDGAGLFLRYFLDPKNYDMSANFINKNMEKTFNELAKMNKRVSITEGVVNYAALVDFSNVCHNIALTNADQVTAKVKSYASNFDVAVNKANKAIK